MRFASTWQMNHRYAAIVALFTLILTTGCASMKDPLKPVAHVDIPRYMGDWYVIANIPYFAEKGCFDSIESYALRSDGNLDNWFTCRKGSFSAPMKRKASAIAVIDDKVSNAVWHVKFFKIISVKYIILDLDPNYQWVAVGHPSRNYGWVMARKKVARRRHVPGDPRPARNAGLRYFAFSEGPAANGVGRNFRRNGACSGFLTETPAPKRPQQNARV